MGSGAMLCLPGGLRRGMSSLACLVLALGAVLGTALLAIPGPSRVEGAADDVVSDAGKVPHAPALHQHHGVLLQVVPDPGNVRRNLDAGRQPYASHLAQRRVGLARSHRVHAHADASPLRRSVERPRLRLLRVWLAPESNELLSGRQNLS